MLDKYSLLPAVSALSDMPLNKPYDSLCHEICLTHPKLKLTMPEALHLTKVISLL